MNRVQAVIIILAVLLMPLGAYAEGKVYQLRVDGLACPFCAYGIEKKLGAIDGVKEVKVDIKNGHVIVTVVEGVTLTEAQARRAVKDAGFTLDTFSQVQGAQ